MSNQIINEVLPFGLPFGVRTIYNNTVVESYAGNQQVFQHSDHDRKEYTIDWTALSHSERNLLRDFLNEHRGNLESFLMYDVGDYQAELQTAQRLSTGTNYQDWGFMNSGSRIYNIVPTSPPPEIWDSVTCTVNGVSKYEGADFSVERVDSGYIHLFSSFVSEPTVLLGCNFMRRVRLVTDRFDYIEVNWNNVQSKIVLREVIIADPYP